MNSPLDRHTEEQKQNDQLNAMSASELADALEQALDAMTDEDYNPEVIRAYLDHLDRKASIPAHPDANDAYISFQKRLCTLSAMQPEQPSQKIDHAPFRLRHLLRVGFAAALITACLLGGIVAAQAAGVDVFGTIARWTEHEFSFGILLNKTMPENCVDSSDSPANEDHSQAQTSVPQEYLALKTELDQRSLPLYIPNIPEGFEATEPLLYIRPESDRLEFSVSYLRGNECIGYDMIQIGEASTTIYEKDEQVVEQYNRNGITYYCFRNLGNKTIAWTTEYMECSITTNSDSVDLKAVIP